MPNATDIPDPTSDHLVRKRRRWIWYLATALVLIVVLLLLWHYYEAKKKAAAAARLAAAARIPVTSAVAKKGDIDVYLNAIGTVTPVYTDSITSQVTGLVVSVLYKEGQLVHKGDPLVEIDSRPYRATLLQAQGALERDQNVLAQAQMDLERYRAALARNAIAEQTVADQEKLVLQDQGTVKNDQGTVQYDQVQVDYCHITAPIDGRVGLRLVDPGNLVQSSGTTTLAVITQLQPITVVFTLPEDSLAPVLARLRAKAKLAVDAFDRSAQVKLASGELVALDNQIDTTTGTVKVRSQFENKDNALFPNQFVNTRLLVDTLQGVTLIPAAAIQQNGQASYVYVLQDNVAHIRPVKPGVTEAGITQVDGINPGDAVATSSFDKLQDNAKVVESKTPVPAAAGGTNAP
jgi:membrane fusion protein, multidrug efflux system